MFFAFCLFVHFDSDCFFCFGLYFLLFICIILYSCVLCVFSFCSCLTNVLLEITVDSCVNALYMFDNPSEFLPNAAGEDVVAGIRTPQPLEEMALKWPEVYAELYKYQEKLEDYYGDMQVCVLHVMLHVLRCVSLRVGLWGNLADLCGKEKKEVLSCL